MESLEVNFNLFTQANFYYVALSAYIIGCVPFALIVGHLGGIGDIRKLGSGNPGATNMARQGGKKLGAITLLLDAGKGAVAVWIGKQFDYATAAALFVVLGHCFSAFLKFKGGKGVATTLGSLLVLNPFIGLTFIGIWVSIFAIYRISSLSALSGIWLTAILSFIFWPGNHALLVLFFAVLITVRHKSNIRKLIKGTEN